MADDRHIESIEALVDYIDNETAPPEVVELRAQLATSNKIIAEQSVAIAASGCALRQVVSSLKTLGIDGWSEAPYLLQECTAALALIEGRK